MLMRLGTLIATLVVALGAVACVSSRVERQFCEVSSDASLVATTIDPAGRLEHPSVPEALRKSVLRYLWGQICDQQACDLYRQAEDIKACEEGYLSTSWILRRKVELEYVGVDQAGGAAAVVITTAGGHRSFAAHFRRSENGEWFVFEPLWEAGIGVP